MKVELHIIQNFPPSNLNRDDHGAPKECELGGVRRGRVSSQCLKRNIRKSEGFGREVDNQIADRTKQSWTKIAELLERDHKQNRDDAEVIAQDAVNHIIKKGAGKDAKAKEEESDDAQEMSEQEKREVLFYVGPDELKQIADLLAKHWATLAPVVSTLRQARMDSEAGQGDSIPETSAEAKPKSVRKPKKSKGIEEAEKVLRKGVETAIKPYMDARKRKKIVGTVDIALFGRMLATRPEFNIDAACQVAHAISTNRVNMEDDYWTAMDDLQPQSEPGASNIGVLGFNSSCYYRYAVVDADQLAKNLGSDPDNAEKAKQARDFARKGIRAFLRGSYEAIPTGKQGAFAHQTEPLFFLAVVREEGMPMSLVNAFEKPARPWGTKSLVEDSIEKLDEHWAELHAMRGVEVPKAFLALCKPAWQTKNLDYARAKKNGAVENEKDEATKNKAPKSLNLEDVIKGVDNALEQWVNTGGKKQ